MNLQIKQKMLLSSLIPLALLICICAVAINMMGKIEQGVIRIYNDRVVPLEDLKIIGDDYAVYVIDAVNKANAGDFTAQEAATALKNANSNISTLWAKYMATELTTEEALLAKQASAMFGPADNQIEQLIKKLDNFSGNIKGQLADEIIPLYQVIDPISGKISELVALQIRVAGDEKQAVTDSASESVKLFLLLAICAIIASVVLSVWVKRSVMTPIIDILGKLKIIKRDSDLTLVFKPLNNDELGQISNDLTGVIEHLRSILESISEAAVTINSSTENLNNFTRETNTRMQNQQCETEQTAAAMNQMTATVAEVAQSTTAAADSAKNADIHAANGDLIVQQSIQSMSLLSLKIQETSEVISLLASESLNIGKVLDVIKSIAEQTNLLALNAAIEAARAGEQGRGFAVVADEVRTLAKRTQESTLQIETMIDSLQQGVKKAVVSMESGMAQVDDANKNTNLAGDALKEIVATVDNITELNTHIATAAEEQSSVAESINRSIITISDISKHSTKAAEELSFSVDELSKLANAMRTQVSTFKLQ
ncbi:MULTISPECIES: methyl-accepting chemotaxis protein [Pseudomonadati]|uniref:Methyl-accepting chemotaxis protein n=1 Tax=Shewanella aestuarii TaxID=1028752 RepID=A0ABT0L4F3_9GAMM|nr:methyl-accepting chemotaxis protein [Shewanella aestuarii]MCL1118618.1 methyl-accepting chemotaxis protein [Shewanella aestuarii]GGN83393.1 methyl-accepting chemotaxis protein [Shewanella aestuarii]